MRTVIVWLAFGVSVSMGQTTIPLPGTSPIFGILFPDFPRQLQEYLGLSDDQVANIKIANAHFASAQSIKAPRQFQLTSEIAQELAKTNPDPLALGTRYAELEVIRRDLQNQQIATISQTQAILNAAQKTKLATLQQALTFYGTACDAVGQNLISLPGVPTGTFSFTSLPPLFSSACSGVATLTVRSGDFLGTIPAPGPLRP